VALTEKDFDLSDAEWSECKARAAAFTSSSFVAFSAYEWGDDGYGDFGHRPVYYLTDNQPIYRSDASNGDHVSELLDDILSSTNGFTSVAHPDLGNYLTDWDYFDGSCDRIAEVYSRHGHYETGDRGLQQALAAGYRFGFVATSDSRSGQPGDYGLTAILSNSLTKAALHAALKARRCYGTSGARIVLQATMDGHAMGEEYISSTGPTLAVDCTPTASLQRIEVLKNNSVVYTYQPSGLVAAPGTSWRTGAALVSANWTDPGFDDTRLELTSLSATLEKPSKSGTPRRLRRHIHLAELPADAILRTNLEGEYKIFLNGTLLVDTRGFRHDDPNQAHDCNAPDAHELAGTPEHFQKLGFYNIAKLGGTLRRGDNILAVEHDATTPTPQPVLEMVTSPTIASVTFTWADAAFTGDSFYYLRVTQVDGQQAWSSPWWVARQAPDTTPPQNPVKLRAHKDSDDVYLDWSKVTKDISGNVETISYYRIFRSTTSDFVPDRSTHTNQIGTSTKARYRDSDALDAAPDYYYKVAAVDAAGNESVGHSNLGFKVHHPLTFHSSISNIYWLSVPYKAVYSNADELARDLNRSSSGPCTKVMRWDVPTQRPVSWVYLGGRWTGTNFPLSSGGAVAITIRQNLDAVLVGAHDEGATVRITNNPGAPSLNWIALPLHTPHQLAFQVVQDANNGYFPGPVTRITRLNADLQTYQTYQWTGSSWSGTNFVLMPGEAYGLEVQATADWLPDTVQP
jgi:hypothetical protein